MYVDDGINFSFEGVSMLKCALTCSNLNFPSGIEKICTWQDGICVVKNQLTSDSHQSEQWITDERCHGTKIGWKVKIGLSPTDSMVPDLESTSTLDLTDDSVRRTDAMMGGLKDGGDTVWYWDWEDEEVAEPEFKRTV